MKDQWHHNPKWNGTFSWGNTAFILLTPCIAIIALPWYLLTYGLGWLEFGLFSAMTTLTGFGITVGYHRMISHQSFESNRLTKFFLLVFGAAALQNSALKWCSDHRYHHRFVDKEGDPYNRTRGFFYSHIGWIFFQDPKDRNYENAHDLIADPMIRWQDKWYFTIAIVFGFFLPMLVGYILGNVLAGFLFGGLFRLLFVHHGTFLINSAAHTFGTRPYSRKNSARDCWWLAFFTNGEGYHNFHHAFANDYRNGLRWYQWDPSKWLIWSLSLIGCSKNLTRTSEAIILKAKLESAVDQYKFSWPQGMPSQLESMKKAVEEKLNEYQMRWREFHQALDSKGPYNMKARARFLRRKLRRERQLLEIHIDEFRDTLRAAAAGQQLAYSL